MRVLPNIRPVLTVVKAKIEGLTRQDNFGLVSIRRCLQSKQILGIRYYLTY